MPHLASLASIDDKLTVESRAGRARLDFWMAISWDEDEVGGWVERFAATAARPRAQRRGMGTLEFVRLSPGRGWVVARAVDRRHVSPEEVERLAHEVVNEVNRQLSAVADPAVVPLALSSRRRGRWFIRAVAAFLAIVVGNVPRHHTGV